MSVTIENLMKGMATISSGASDSEIVADDIYHRYEFGKFGYFEDFYRVWSDLKIKQLQAEVKEVEESRNWYMKNSTEEYNRWDEQRTKLEEKLAEGEKREGELKDRLINQLEALEVIRFYGDVVEWNHDGQEFGEFGEISITDVEPITETIYVGGKRAREFMKKYEVKNETI